MAAAYELTEQGYQVVVFEQESFAGGRMRTVKRDGFNFDGGASFLAANYYNLKRYAQDLGVEWVATRPGSIHRVLRDGKMHELSIASPLSILRMSFLPFSARLKLLGWLLALKLKRFKINLFDLSELPDSLFGIDLVTYMDEKIHPDATTYLADAFTSIMQFHRAKDITAGALVAYFKMMMTKGEEFALSYTPRGMGEIPTRMAEKLDVRYKTRVKLIRPARGRVEVQFDSGKKQFFDKVILATTAAVGVKIVDPVYKDHLKILSNTEYSSTVTIGIEVDQKEIPAQYHLNYVPYKENQRIGGYGNEYRKPGATPPGKSLISLYLHEETAVEVLDWPDIKIFEKLKLELPFIFPELDPKKAKLHSIQKWWEAMPKFTPEHIIRVKWFQRTHQGDKNLYLAGDYMNGPWTEGASRTGVKAAQQVIEDLSRN